MATNFPTSLDSYTTKNSGDIVQAADVNNPQSALVAIETKVGVDSSAVNTTLDFKLGEVTAGDKAAGKTATQTLTNKTLTSPVMTNPSTTGTDSGAQTLQNKTIAGASNTLTVREADLSTSDVTTANVTSTKHGFAPKSPAAATQFLNGAATPAFAQVLDSDLSTSDITTNNVATTKHGFAPKLPNDATKYLDGTGAYTVPATSVTFKNGIATYAGNTASGNQTIAHGLGKPPSKVKITALKNIAGGANQEYAFGAYNGTTTSSVFLPAAASTGAAATSTNMLELWDNSGGTAKQVATISTDATNITLAWTKSGAPSADNICELWEVEA